MANAWSRSVDVAGSRVTNSRPVQSARSPTRRAAARSAHFDTEAGKPDGAWNWARISASPRASAPCWSIRLFIAGCCQGGTSCAIPFRQRTKPPDEYGYFSLIVAGLLGAALLVGIGVVRAAERQQEILTLCLARAVRRLGGSEGVGGPGE